MCYVKAYCTTGRWSTNN